MEDNKNKDIRPHKPRRRLKYALTDTILQKIYNQAPPNKNKKYSDGDGLFIEHTTTGKMIWKVDYSVKGEKSKSGNYHRTKKTIGYYIGRSKSKKTSDNKDNIPILSLSQARRKAEELKIMAHSGINPHKEEIKKIEEERKKQDEEAKKLEKENKKRKTFKEITILWYEDKIQGSSITKTSKRTIKTRIENHLYPVIGDMMYKDISLEVLEETIKGIYEKQEQKTFLTKNLIYDLNRIGKWAKSRKYSDNNPAEELAEECSGMKPKINHHKAITNTKKLSEYLNKLEYYTCGRNEALTEAMMVIVYIPVRSSELTEAKVKEIDFEDNIWTIPKERMKAREDFVVPLSSKIATIFKNRIESNPSKDGDDYVYQSLGKHIGVSSMRGRLRSMGYSKDEVTIHGFRSTFSTLMRKADLYSEEIIERNLSHLYGDPVSRAYNRGGYIEKRRQCYEDYGYILDGLKEGKDFNELVKELKRKHFEEDMKMLNDLNTPKS